MSSTTFIMGVEPAIDTDLVRWMTGYTVDNDRYADFFEMTNYEIEHRHNYIQWAFPTDQASAFNEHAPILNKLTLDEIKRRDAQTAETQITLMAEKMLRFYREDLGWMSRDNHNLLRISRIIRSLNLFVTPTRAEWFYHSVYGIALRHARQDWIPEHSRRIWTAHCHPGLYYLVK